MGLGIKPFMCSLRNEGNRTVTLTRLTPCGGRLTREPVTAQDDRPGRVLVNGRVPKAHLALRHMDRLILGHAFCFRLIVPLVSVTPNAGRDSLLLACQGGIEEALQEVVHEDSPEFADCRAMLDSIQDRIGSLKVKAFLQEFGMALPLVEEGNLITSEVRPQDHLRFHLEVCSDIKTFTTGEPELIVRLYKEQERSEGSKPMVMGVFELSQYLERLEDMREVYQAFQVHPKGMAEAAKVAKWDTGQNPWAVCGYKELRQLQEQLAQRDAQLTRLLREADPDTARSASAPGLPGPCREPMDNWQQPPRPRHVSAWSPALGRGVQPAAPSARLRSHTPLRRRRNLNWRP